MPNYYRFEQQFFEYLKTLERNIKASPLYLGLGSGAGSNIIGTLPQTRVSYDSVELASSLTPFSPSLLDNLNHIRKDIETLSAVPSGESFIPGHVIYDDTIELEQREKLVLSGAGVTIVDNVSNDSTDISIHPSFLNLIDTPSGYVTKAGKTLIVSPTETGLQFTALPGAAGGGKILRYDSGGNDAEEYDPDEDGLRSALSDATSGDIVLLPPQTITVEDDGLGYGGTGSLKINAGVTLRGTSREYSKIVANIAKVNTSPRILIFCYNEARIENLTVEYERDNGGVIIGIYYPVLTEDTGITLSDLTLITKNNSTSQVTGISIQAKSYEDRDTVAINDCFIYTEGGSAENVFTVRGDTHYWNTKVFIKDSIFVGFDSTIRTNNDSTALHINGDCNERIVVDNCYIYGETEVNTSNNRLKGIYGDGNIEVKDCVSVVKNPSIYVNSEALAIELWANSYPGDDIITDLMLVRDCIGLAISSSASVSSSYQTCGIQISDGSLLGGLYRATCDGASDQVFGAYIYASYYDFDVRNATFEGNTYDLWTYNNKAVKLYGCQYETLHEAYGTVTILPGDRASFYPESYHSNDIEDFNLTRHLPLPTISGYIAVVSEGEWVLSPIDGAGSGAGTFLDLTDTPSDYTGHLGKVLVVASGETGIDFTDAGAGDMIKSTYDSNDDGVVDGADVAPWSGITDKPSTYPPSTHNHDSDYYTETEVDTKLALQDEFTELTDSPSSYSGEDGKVIAVKNTEDGLEFVTQSGSDFLSLTDTPSSYVGQAGRVPLVNDSETGLVLSGAGAGDMYKSIYDADEDGIIDEIPWNDVTDKPTTFTPSAHSHDDRYYRETEIDTKLMAQDEFLDMDDSPFSYAGQGLKAIIVSETEDQLEFVDIAGVSSGVYNQSLTSAYDEYPDFLIDKFVAGSGIVLSEIWGEKGEYTYNTIQIGSTWANIERQDIGACVHIYDHFPIPPSGWTSIEFDLERWDTDDIHDTFTDNTRLTCKTPGKYAITGNVFMSPLYGDPEDPVYQEVWDKRYIRIWLNDTWEIATDRVDAYRADTSGVYLHVDTIWDLEVGDYVELQVWHNSIGSVNAYHIGKNAPNFMMQLVEAFGPVDFVDLIDTPIRYSGAANKVLAVTPEEDGVEFVYKNIRQVTLVSGAFDMTYDREEYDVIICSGEGLIELPDASLYGNLSYTFKRIDDGGGNVTLSGADQLQLIDGEQYYYLSNQYDKVTIVSDGTEWLVITDDGESGDGTGDMLKSVYDTDNDGNVNEAEITPWTGITGKPSTYPPDSHDHDDLYYTETEVDTKLALQDEFIELTDSPSSYSGESRKIIAVKNTEDGLEFVVQSGAGSGAGASTFTELIDVPSSYTGEAGKYTIVNEAEDALEFAVGTGSGGGASDLLDLTDTPVTYSGASGKSLVVNDEEDGVEFVTVSGVQDIGCRVYNSSDQAISNNTWTDITFDSERYDTDTIHDTSSNTERLTCKTAGKYIITGNFVFEASAAGADRSIGIFLNNTTYIATSCATPLHATLKARGDICTIYNLSVDDFVTLRVQHNAGSDLNIDTGGNFSPEFSIQKIG